MLIHARCVLSAHLNRERAASMNKEEQEQQPRQGLALHPSTARIIDGPLSEGRRLAYPLKVMVEYDDGEVVVSEPHFHIHASGPTEAEAIAAFRRIFSGYLDVLSSREE